METKFLSRKFLLALASLGSASFLCWMGKIDGTAFLWVVNGTVGAYMTTNVWQKKNGVQP